MIKWFIQHQWKKEIRSSIWQKNIALNIVIGFFMLIMLSYVLMLGLFLDKILEEVVKNANADVTLSKIIIYYFIVSFMMRFFFKVFRPWSLSPICIFE